MTELNPMETGETTGELGSTKAALWSYLDILRRRIWIVMALVIITSTLGLIKAFRAPLIYRAQARLLVEQHAPSVMQFRGSEAERWDPDFYRTQAELFTSRAVMEVALESPPVAALFAAGRDAETRRRLSSIPGELKRTLLAVFGVPPPAPPATWELLGKQVIADHLPDTHFIQVASQHSDPHRATLIANEVARAFKEYHRRTQKALLGEAFSMLELEKEKEELSLLEAEREMQQFRERAQTVSVATSSQDQPAIERLVKLNQELTDVQLARIELSAQIGVMREALGSDDPARQGIVDERLFSIPIIQTDLELSRTRRELAESEKSLTVLLETYGPNHPVLLGAQTNIVLLRNLFRNALREIVSSHENRLQILALTEADLQSSYDDQRRVTLDLAKEEFELTRLQNKVDRHRRLFDALVDRMRELDVTSGLSRTNVQITQEATLPTTPINVGKMQTFVFFTFLGLFLGMGLAFLFENLDDTIKTPEDLKERGDLPLLGFVPQITIGAESDDAEGAARGGGLGRGTRRFWSHISQEIRTQTRQALKEIIPQLDREEPDAKVEDRRHRGSIVLTEPVSSVAEAYRSIRASLFYSSPGTQLRLIAVTSCRPKEGKTTTSTNLAISIAQTGKRVLLIDGDLHRPSVHRTLGLDGSRGLTNVLIGEMGWREALQQVEQEGRRAETLDVLGAGPTTPHPSELLGSTRMQHLLREARDAYDWVIVDTPPVLFVTDASVLSVQCDGVILVVRAGYSTNTLLARATEKLRDVRVRMVGGILNNVIVSRVGRYYSTYYNVGYARYAKDYHRSYYAGEGEELPVPAAAVAPSAPDAASPPEAVDPKDALQRQLTAERARAAQLEGERNRLQTRITALETEVASTQAALTALRRQPAGAAEADLESHAVAQERDGLRRELETLRARLAARDADVQEWRRRLEENQSGALARERDAGAQIERLSRELDALRGERNRLQDDLVAERTRDRQEAPETRAATQALEQRLAAAQAEGERLRREDQQQRESLTRQLEAARSEIADLTRQSEEARQRALAAEQAHQEWRDRVADAPPATPTPPTAAPIAESEPEPDFSRGRQVRAALQQADLHLAAGAYAQARTLLEKLVKARPDQWDGWERLLPILARQDDRSALDALSGRFSGGEARGHYLYALCHGYRARLAGDGAAADVYFEQALKADAKSVPALEALTRSALQRLDADAVARHVDRLLRLDPGNAFAYYAKGSLEYVQGRAEQAEIALKRSVQLGKTPEALNDLSLLLKARGQTAEAEALARAARELHVPAET